MSAPDLGVLVLAAGLSRRLEGPNKLLVQWRGKPLIAHVIAQAEAVNSCAKLLVSHRDPADVSALLLGLQGWNLVENHKSVNGLSSSLVLGLRALSECRAVLVLLGDMPGTTDQTLQAVIDGCADGVYASVPTFGGVWGNPVCLSSRAMADCLTLTGDQGAKKLLQQHQDTVALIEVSDPAILADFDTAEDFLR